MDVTLIQTEIKVLRPNFIFQKNLRKVFLPQGKGTFIMLCAGTLNRLNPDKISKISNHFILSTYHIWEQFLRTKRGH